MQVFFKYIIQLLKANNHEPEKNIEDVEREKQNKELMVKVEQVKELFKSTLIKYNSTSCQCAFPRYQQLISIDCSETRKLFKSVDTEILISLSKPYFERVKSELNNECTNEKWTCLKCGSIYEYGWSDFSIYFDRQILKLVSLKVDIIGKKAITPIPLFLGLEGHSYPYFSNTINVGFSEFEKYIKEL